jgi:cytoskeletal protein RodZ
MVYYLIIGAYIILYIGMILYDLLHKDPTEAQPKQEEEEIDITQEAEQFKPVEVTKDMPDIQNPAKVEKATTSEKSKEDNPQKENDDSAKKTTTEPTKHEQPQTSKMSDADNSSKEDPHQMQEPPAEKQQSNSGPATDERTSTHEDTEESGANPTQYTGAKKFDDLEKEIVS